MCQQIHIDADNYYLQGFFKVNEYIEKNKLEVQDVSLCIGGCLPSNPEIHPGQLNIPSAPDVAVLMPNSLQNMNTTRTLVLNYQESGNYRNDLKTIADFHRSYDPLQYPLIFPQGTDGWHFKL